MSVLVLVDEGSSLKKELDHEACCSLNFQSIGLHLTSEYFVMLFSPIWRARMQLENIPLVSCFNKSEILPNSFARDTGERNLWCFPILTRTYWPGKHPVKSVAWGRENVYSASVSPRGFTECSFRAVNSFGLREGLRDNSSSMSRDFNIVGGLVLNGFSNSESW